MQKKGFGKQKVIAEARMAMKNQKYHMVMRAQYLSEVSKIIIESENPKIKIIKSQPLNRSESWETAFEAVLNFLENNDMILTKSILLREAKEVYHTDFLNDSLIENFVPTGISPLIKRHFGMSSEPQSMDETISNLVGPDSSEAEIINYTDPYHYCPSSQQSTLDVSDPSDPFNSDFSDIDPLGLSVTLE